MQASVCVWRVQPGYIPLIQVWKVVWVCNGCSRGIPPSPKYARFRECVKGAAGVSPPHLIMQGLVSMHWVQLGCLPLTWVCMISVGEKRNRERLVQLGYLPLTSACAVCQYRLYESIHQSSCYHYVHIYFLCPCWLLTYALGHKGLHPLCNRYRTYQIYIRHC